MKKGSAHYFKKRNNRLLLPVVIIASFALLGSGIFAFLEGGDDTTNPSANAATTCTISDKLVNSCRPWLGAVASHYPNIGGSNSYDNTVQIPYFNKRLNDPEALTNPTKSVTITKKLDFVHVYKSGSFQLSTYDKSVINSSDSYLQMNWKPSATSFAAADGRDAAVNTAIDTVANNIKSVAPNKVMIALFHEPENDVTTGSAGSCYTVSGQSTGSPSDYVNMWKNVRQRFEALGVTNTVWAMNYMGFSNYDCMVPLLWPGNDLVDWVLWDAYDGGAVDYTNAMKRFYTWMENNSDTTHAYTSKPWGLGEFGYWNKDGDSTEANSVVFWQQAKQSLVANSMPRIKLYSVYDSSPSASISGASFVGLQFNETPTASINEQTAFNDFATTLLNTGAPTTPPTTTGSADINSDGKVDISDLSTLISKWGTNDTLSDINKDGAVNIFDLSLLISKWGTVGSTAPETAYTRGLAWYQQNTGVPAGTTLTASGGLTINTDGTIITDKDINGNVTVNAKNVTIKNSRIKGSVIVDHGEATYNTVIDHVDIDLSSIAIDSSGNSNKYGVAAWWGTTVKNSKIHGMAQGIAFSGYLTATDNYIYGIRSNVQHSECILSNGDSSTGGGNSTIQRNWLDSNPALVDTPVSSAMSMYGDFGQIKNVVVDGNYFTGLGYLLYPGATKAKPYPWPYNVAVTNNTFDTTGYGPVYPSQLDALSESLWKNNKLITGAAVPAPQGNN